MDMLEFERQFKNPSKEYRIAPFWFLNHEFDETELRRQIAEMDEKGVGGAVLHPRHGMKVEYMSEEYFKMIGTCIDEMDRRGMQVWLYDENNWPSGTYDGKLTRDNPKYRMRYIRIESFKVSGGYTFTLNPEFHEGNSIIDIQAARYDEEGVSIRINRDTITYITDKLEDGCVHWDCPAGKWLVCVFWECFVAAKVTYKNGYYLDTMNEEAVNEFIRLAYEPYMRFSDFFGKTVRGFFTDEPGLMIHDGFFQPNPISTRIDDLEYSLPGYVMAWTRAFFDKFHELKGYDFKNCLFSLLYNIGEDTEKIRLDYYDALTTWYVESYHKAIGTWCRNRGLKYIGHTLEDPLWAQVRTQGNQTRVLQQMDYPGYDYLGQGVGNKENPYRILAAKCASSVAHIEGKERVICESFGGGGHNHSLFTRKLDANFMALLGTNLFIPHGYYYSFEGYRKTDWPPTEFYHAPHWTYYKGYADYLARLSLVVSTGLHKADACLLSPNKTVCVEMFENGKAERTPKADTIFAAVSDLMMRFHYDYDYVDDCQLKNAITREGKIGFDSTKETYQLVILPCVRIISLGSAKKLEEYYAAGGKILFIDCIPELCDEAGEDESIKTLFQRIYEQGAVNGRAELILFGSDFEVRLQAAVRRMVEPEVQILKEDGSLAEDALCCRREIDGDTFYLIFNRLMESQRVRIRFSQTGALHEWNIEDGSITILGENKSEIELELSAAQMRILELWGGEHSACKPSYELPLSPSAIIPLNGLWEFKTREPNVLKLNEWIYKTRDWEAMEQERIAGVPGQVNSYTAVFEADEIPEGEIIIVLDDLKQWIPSHVGFLTRTRSLEVYLNGSKVETFKQSAWQEKHYQQAHVEGLLKAGVNRLTIHTISLLNPMHSLVEPVYIIGNFAVKAGRLCRSSEKINGYWTDNGYPFYSGIGTYSKEFVLDSEPGRLKAAILKLGRVKDGCAVKLNGKLAGIRYWPLYELDILRFLQEGNNTIEIEVFNTLENLYGKDVLESGLSNAEIEIYRLTGHGIGKFEFSMGGFEIKTFKLMN